MNMILSQAELKERLAYNPETGDFTWIAPAGMAGKRAGTVHHSGYIQISFGGKLYLAQRLAFVWMVGRFPADGMEADHIDLDKRNNAWCNLREVTKAQNAWNVGRRGLNTSGVKGVSWRSDKRKWEARITYHRREIKLGYFDSLEMAGEFRQLAADMLHGSFARHA